MAKSKIGGRKLRRIVDGLLRCADPIEGMASICRLPLRQVVNPLIMSLNHREEIVKWRAVSALGAVVAKLAADDMESARVVMRRLMWSLNSESGGVGWGCAEAMGEIMASQEQLAREYASILLSYISDGENFIENRHLQKGVLWAVGRLASVRPSRIEGSAALLLPFLASADATLRGLAAWAARGLADVRTTHHLIQLAHDTETLLTYMNHKLVQCRVADLAKGMK